MTLRPVPQAGEHHEDGGLVLLQPGLDVNAVDPEVFTGSRSASGRVRQSSYSACHPAFSRAIEAADSGAPSPSSPRRARSKSPSARPCRYSCGSSCPTASVRRLNTRQELTFEPLGQPADAWPAQGDRPRAQAQPPGLPKPVAIAGRGIDAPRAARIASAAQQHRRPLPPAPSATDLCTPLPGEGLQALPHRP